MRDQPFFTIVIPTKNEEKNIENCIKSILACDYPKPFFEVIVVDNGSVDRTATIAEQLGASVYTLPGVTIAGLRNFGVSKAKGNIVGFVDADCEVDKKLFGEVKIVLGEKANVACGGWAKVDSNSTWVQKAWTFRRHYPTSTLKVPWLPSMSLFVKKDVFIDVKGFDETLKTCEDVDLCYRLNKKGNIIASKGLNVLHTGEPKTVKAFFVRELWHGQSNLKGLEKHGIVFSELPSLFLPFYVYLTVAVAMYGLIKLQAIYCYVALCILFLPPTLLALKCSIRNKDSSFFVQLAVLYSVYFVARSFAVLIKFSKHT